MSNAGLTKLTEECGELVQACMKKVAYPNTDRHPDGTLSMRARIEEEMGDVQAAMAFVCAKFKLDRQRINNHSRVKLERFLKWDKE